MSITIIKGEIMKRTIITIALLSSLNAFAQTNTNQSGSIVDSYNARMQEFNQKKSSYVTAIQSNSTINTSTTSAMGQSIYGGTCGSDCIAPQNFGLLPAPTSNVAAMPVSSATPVAPTPTPTPATPTTVPATPNPIVSAPPASPPVWTSWANTRICTQFFGTTCGRQEIYIDANGVTSYGVDLKNLSPLVSLPANISSTGAGTELGQQIIKFYGGNGGGGGNLGFTIYRN